MTQKLAGVAKGTALWVSSVSNEKGQVLIIVLTAQEGPGLDRMVSCLIRRYSEAGVAPLILLYVDCGCCKETGGESKLKAWFGGWPDSGTSFGGLRPDARPTPTPCTPSSWPSSPSACSSETLKMWPFCATPRGRSFGGRVCPASPRLWWTAD